MWPNNLTYASVIVSPNRAEETSNTTLNTSTFKLLQEVIGRSQEIEHGSIFCDRLRSCDHMETKVLQSAIEMYPVIFLILIQRF